MRIIEKTWQHRNDFEAILECNHCGSFQTMSNGYDDRNFHVNVLPAIRCRTCEKRGVETLPDGITDPGYQGGKIARRVIVETESWEINF